MKHGLGTINKATEGAGGGDVTITGLPFDFVPNVVYSTSEVYVSAKVRHKAGEGKFLNECCELYVEF